MNKKGYVELCYVGNGRTVCDKRLTLVDSAESYKNRIAEGYKLVCCIKHPSSTSEAEGMEAYDYKNTLLRYVNGN